MLEGLLLGHLGAVDADALELEAGLGGVCGEREEWLERQERQRMGKASKERNQGSNRTRTGPGKFIVPHSI